MKNFYITTTLPYVNAEPHIGFALEIVQADVLARYHRLLGDEVIFNFGTDEHGQKIYQKAVEVGKDPQVYCDEYAAKFDSLKSALNLSYTNFIRTTDSYHKKAAQEFWQRSKGNGDIYKAKYKVKYCVGCELEKTDSELKDGRCPIHPKLEIEIRDEENYFFRWSKYRDQLLDFYQKHLDFVIPDFRYKEIKNFVDQGLKDFSISRLKAKMPWGVEVPDDPDHVMYVWFDALVNYVSTIGWPDREAEFNKWWPVIQVAGKDNLRQQAAMWQAMLMSAGLPNSKQIIIHGFITADGQKMSKSLGNVVSPYDLVKKYGTDATRYFLLAKINPFEDGDFTYAKFEEAYNSDLANGLGNLAQRVAKMAEGLDLEKLQLEQGPEANLLKKIEHLIQSFKFNEALEIIWLEIGQIDRYINNKHIWSLAVEEKQKELRRIIQGTEGITGLRDIAEALQPFLPETAERIWEIFRGPKIIAPEKPLFPRLK